LPDPCDEQCPSDFKKKARELLPQVVGKIGPKDEDLRQTLLKFIGDFANWDLSADRTYLEVSRGLVKAAHGEEAPLVVDPFAGGGSIPLEALRLGCEAFASDLNPVACLILKTMLEDIPRHGPELAEELRRVGAEIKAAAEKELADFYPSDKDGAKPIAYLWARTVRCESHGCGAEIPLVRSFWLCKKANRKRALRYKVVRGGGKANSRKPSPLEGEGKGEGARLEFEIFEPKNDREVPSGTVTRAKATCPCCNVVLPPERVRAQLREQRGGADVLWEPSPLRGKGEGETAPKRTGGARLLAVVTLKPGEQGRQYRLPTDHDYEAVWKAQKASEKVAGTKLTNGLRPVPDENIPNTELRRISIPLYGCKTWGDAFTQRQLLSLVTFAGLLRERIGGHPAVAGAASLCISRMTNALTAFSRWHLSRENIEGVFSRQAVGMVWDFCEGNPLSDSTGGLGGAIDWVGAAATAWPGGKRIGHTERADCASVPIPDETAGIWFTDPPYYDSVPYSHLSDLFYVWLKRTLGTSLPSLFQTLLTPKDTECVVDRPHSASDSKKTADYYERKMGAAMVEGRRILQSDGIGCVVFAHKSTEGWEALLAGITNAGWVLTASWPITTEMATRNTARDTASLAASVHLVCRPRPDNAPIGDWADVLRELPNRIGDWMERLSAEGVRGADLVFACIGPAMEVYSRYSKVEDAEGREIPLGGDPTAAEPYKRGFLAYVWETVGRTALGQILGTAEARARNGVAGALEEDARLTALFLWTLQATDGDSTLTPTLSPQGRGGMKGRGSREEDEDDTDDEDDGGKSAKKKGFTLIYDVARRFAQPLGIHLDQWEGRIIETEKGIVRLLPVSERAEQLFGEEGASAVADRIEANPKGPLQMGLFSGEAPAIKGRGRVKAKRGSRPPSPQPSPSEGRGMKTGEATTLDRVHAAMLLQASGRANALRALLKAEQERGPDFLRLANALSALYPKDSEEKRLLDAMLLAVPR
jgi:adenine-specific DNA methylase